MTLYIKHNFGFFSTCSVILYEITKYIKINNKLPIDVNTLSSFNWYKNNEECKSKKDIRYNYFKEPSSINNEIDIKNTKIFLVNSQYDLYSKFKYDDYKLLMETYFSPTDNIQAIVNTIETKYELNYDNICVLFYRGNDKCTETTLSKYEDYISYANKIIEKQPNIKFLIQSDETEFINYIADKYPDNSFYFKDEIRHIKKNGKTTVDHVMKKKNSEFSKKYLAITLIMARCKYVICGTGNCSIWIMLFRGNANNTIQFMKGNWYENI